MSRSFIVLLLFALTACNSNEESYSRFADLLEKQPYKPLTDSIEEFPKRHDLYFRRAVLLNKNNQREPALADFRKAWSMDKEETYAIGVSNLLLETRPDSGIVFINEALRELPKSTYLRLTLARTYSALERDKDAIAVCEQILQQDPDQLNTLMLAAELYEKTGNTARMVAVLERAYSLEPSRKEITNSLAYRYAELKNPKALVLADSLIKADSLKENADPYYIKGLYYSNIKQDADAIRWFDQTIQHDHRYLQAYIEKGKVQLDHAQLKDALATFSLANEISPAFPDAWYWMGVAQEKMGLKEEALTNYEKAFGLDKSFTEARDAARALQR